MKTRVRPASTSARSAAAFSVGTASVRKIKVEPVRSAGDRAAAGADASTRTATRGVSTKARRRKKSGWRTSSATSEPIQSTVARCWACGMTWTVLSKASGSP
jgi:tRNA G18 (ribose-2'-O)-methylase SpoU